MCLFEMLKSNNVKLNVMFTVVYLMNIAQKGISFILAMPEILNQREIFSK